MQFLKDTSKCIIPEELHNQETVCVYREGYSLPEIPVKFIEIDKYRTQYMALEPKCIIIIGLNSIIKPSNRCDLLHEYWQENTSTIQKFSIDTSPFVGEPWRFWFHFSVSNNNVWHYPHSYFVETKWKKWFYRSVKKNPTNLSQGSSLVYSDIGKLNSSFSFRECHKFEVDHYKAVKETAFALHDTPKSIIAYMSRNLKDLVRLSFEDYLKDVHLELPDLPICRFYAEENIRRQNFYNEVLGNG